MKYVMVRDGEHVYPIIFPNRFVHADMAEAFAAVIKKYNSETPYPDKLVEPVSAGEVNIFDAACSGSSDTLKLEARKGIDSGIVMMGEYMAYFEGLPDGGS